MKIIDTHQHLIYPDKLSNPWTKNVPALANKQFRVEEYRLAAQGTGITETLFMEVDVVEPQIKAETEFFLDLAKDPHTGIVGVLGNCRPEHENFPAYLESVLHPKLKGLRRILHVVPDELSQTPLFAKNLSLLAKHNLTFDLCLLARQLPIGAKLIKQLPNQQFILDHCGVPDIKANVLDPWRQHIRELAKFPNLACKISGVVVYCDPHHVTTAAIRPYVEHCIECFGWDRVMFGGDWPVCNITSSLGKWVEILKEIVAKESPANQEKLFSKNAERIYRIPK
ncbi:MAG TPA: amidohydrolase [Verrucomicrobiae bacterium]|jgi:predicted TIM-barrel fold metal-dependent hydrolase|nr:amidohydrolase [Verrucomicrobiae bacterium]